VSDTHLPSERELLLVETARLGCTNKKFKLRDASAEEFMINSKKSGDSYTKSIF
jgi:hypothetical protein